MPNRVKGALVGILLTALILTPAISSARLYLFDRKLELNGSIEQKFNWKFNLKDWEKGTGPHNSRVTPGGRLENRTQSNGGRYPQNNPTLFKTHLHLEALYHAYNEGQHLVDFFTLIEWFYDWGVDINPSYERGIRARDRESFKANSEFEDIVRELYVNYVRGPWTLRVGKQMVVWGETGLQRTADVVNPVDLRAHIMGVDDWEDFKQGLWMFRGFYQTSFANDLTFEWIVVPYDVKVIELAPEGTMYNSTYTGGFTSQMWKRWRHDEPNEHGLSDSQGGIRIRGFNLDWDWTLIYYNGYDPSPIAWDWGQRANGYTPTTPLGFSLYSNGVGGFNLYAAVYNIASEFGYELPRWPRKRMFKYYRTHNFGGTATKYVYKVPFLGFFEIPLKANIRTEWAYKMNTRFNTQSYQVIAGRGEWFIDGRTRVDQFAFAIEIGKDFMPQWICRYNSQRSVDVTVGYFVDWLLDRPKRLFLEGWGRGGGDRSSQSFSFDMTTDWFNNELMTKINLSYNLSGNGSIYGFFQYAPGVHWRFTLLPRYVWSNAGPYNNKGNASYKGYTEKNDSTNYIHFKIGYLF